MNVKKWESNTRQLKALLRETHSLLDETPEMEDCTYLQLVCQLNEFRQDLFSALEMLGVHNPMTEREVAPDTSSAVTKKRQWNSSALQELDGALNRKPPPPPVASPPLQSPRTDNPFTRGFGPDW